MTTDTAQQQAWWDSMTPEQREAYEDQQERNRAERDVYGRVLTDDERAAMTTNRPTDEELIAQYEMACALSARLYDQGADDSAAEAEADRILAELQERGIA